VIGISNNHMFKHSLDPRVKSTLCEYEIFFSPYDDNDLTKNPSRRGDTHLVWSKK